MSTDSSVLHDVSTNTNNTNSRVETPVTPPVFADDVAFVDAHMHCRPAEISASVDSCVVSETWLTAAQNGAAGVILSTAHWATNYGELAPTDPEYELAQLIRRSNDVYQKTAESHDRLAFFTSLDCWHDTPFGATWVDACKQDARDDIARGAVGFKDHVGKQWDGGDLPDSENGIFSGAFTRRQGLCTDVTGDTPNRDCVQTDEVIYPLLTDEWREVVRFIVQDLKAPIITHATTYYGAEADCWDPLTGAVDACPAMSREHLLEFARWAAETLTVNERKRIVVAHGAFMIPGDRYLPRAEQPALAQAREQEAQALLAQFDALLAFGLSVDSATTADFVAMTKRQDGEPGACVLRQLFARYPDQIVFASDRILDNQGCLEATYSLWEDLLTNDILQQGPTRDTCFGARTTFGLALDQTTVPECQGEIPQDTLQRFLKLNFLNLYNY